MMGFAILLLLLLFGGFGIGVVLYNGMVRKRNTAKNAFAQIDVQLKRRHDLIPNLVNTAEQYLTHEKETLQQVIAARNNAAKLQQQPDHQADKGAHIDLLAKAEGMLSKALGQFYAVVENYPDIKADSIITELMNELQNTENRIGFARQAFNDAVMFYNNAREVFPGNIVAGMFSFNPMNLLHFEDSKALQQAPKVQFSQAQ